MRYVKTPFLFLFCLLLMEITYMTKAQATQNVPLNKTYQRIIPIAAFTANGNTEKLKEYLAKALDDKVTINEIKDALVQLYAYTGFPRSLTALGTFRNLVEERKAQGIHDEVGKEATPLPVGTNIRDLGTQVQTEIVGFPVKGAVYDFAPAIDTYLKEHLFGAIFSSDVLTFQQREIVTISALASLPAEAQLRSHFTVCLNVGITQEELQAFTLELERTVGTSEATLAKRVLTEVLQKRK